MDYKFKNNRKSLKLQRKYSDVLKQYSDEHGQLDIKGIIRSEVIPSKHVLEMFIMTPKQLKDIHSPRHNSFVWDVRQGWGFEFIECPVGPIKFFDGRPVQACARLGDGSLVPIERPKNLDTPPEKLYRAINWKSETTVLFSMKQELLEKLQMGGIAVIIVIMLFFAFVLVNS